MRSLLHLGTLLALAAGLGWAGGGCKSHPPRQPAAAPPPPVPGRVLFLGDSITYSGQYVAMVETALRVHPLRRSWEILNLGLPSETVSGLSEPGHAGGAFPRPDLAERLDRVLAKTRPEILLACYGMNDGIYHPFSEERFARFQAGIRHLRARAAAHGARLIHLTPAAFDAQPIRSRTLPAGLDAYPQPYAGYDEVLARYAAWLMERRAEGWEVIDIHTAMKSTLAARRQTQPEFRYAGDGVHPNDEGHWVMAQEVLSGLGVSTVSARAVVDFAEGRVVQIGQVSQIVKTNGGIELTWHTAPPMPLEASRVIRAYPDRTVTSPGFVFEHALLLRNAPAGQFEFQADGKRMGIVSLKDQPIPTRRYPEFETTRRAREILRLVGERQRVLRDAWLTETGHQRPGLDKGLPLAEAQARGADLGRQIDDLNRETAVRICLMPSP